MLKAVFLERFSRFVTWPEDVENRASGDPFTITILGDDPFDGLLQQIYRNRKIRGRRVRIRNVFRIVDVMPCQILYVSPSSECKLSDIAALSRKNPVLTVGDTPGLAEQGMHIGFFLENGRIRFAINEAAVRNSRLKISYRLFQVARIIHPPE